MPPTERHDASSPLLETVGLSCSRGGRLLFEDLALCVSAGEVVQVHGANGSGKTTLLRILCGLQPPTAGHVRWRGRDVSPGAPELRADVQYVGHAGGVKIDLTPRENLDFAIALGARAGYGAQVRYRLHHVPGAAGPRLGEWYWAVITGPGRERLFERFNP